MIYLSTIMSSDIWDLKALYEGANVQRLVASVTIMDLYRYGNGRRVVNCFWQVPEHYRKMSRICWSYSMICSACQPLLLR